MLESARQERQSLVDESSVLAEAEDDAERLIADARADVARMRAETDDYVDASLARFEALLEHTLATVGRGRDKLHELSDSAQQQEFPDPDGQVGMPVTSGVGLGEPLGGEQPPPEALDLDEAAGAVAADPHRRPDRRSVGRRARSVDSFRRRHSSACPPIVRRSSGLL